jgi:hypothetical protein
VNSHYEEKKKSYQENDECHTIGNKFIYIFNLELYQGKLEIKFGELFMKME